MRRSMLHLAVVLCALLVVGVSGVAGSAGSGEARWAIRDLGWDGPAADVNESGQIVGDGFPPSSGPVRDWAAFLWQKGRVIDLGVLTPASSGYVTVGVRAINDRGQAIGTSTTHEKGTTPVTRTRGFVWEKGKMVDLGALPGFMDSYPLAINERGKVVGFSSSAGGRHHAFLWQKGKMQSLGTLGGKNSEAVAINEDGHVVGASETGAGRLHAFVWQNGRMTDLGVLPLARSSRAIAINERGQVIGNSYSDPKGTQNPRAFLWRNGKLTDLGAPSGYFSEARAINDRGQVIGTFFHTAGQAPVFPFLWQHGKLARLPLPVARLPFRLRADEGEANAINERSQIVGECKFQTAFTHGCLWANGSVTDLGALGLDAEKEAHARAVAINEHNQIVGISQNRMDFAHAVLWTLKPT